MPDLSNQYLENRQSDESLDNREWLKQLTQQPPEPVSTPIPPTVEFKKESHLGNLFKGVWEQTKEVGKAIVTTPEVALSTVTGMAAWPIAKAGGLMTMPFWGGEEAQKFEDYLGQLYTYQPKIPTGQLAVEKIGKVAEIPFKPAKWLGNVAEKITGSPEVKYGVTAVGEVATMFLIPKITGKAKELIKGKPIEKPVGISDVAIERPPEPKIPTKEETLGKARGDLTAEMEKINQRAHDAIQTTYDQIPKKQWDEWWIDEKPKNIGDVSKLVGEHAERLKAEKQKMGPDYDKLPQSYKDAITREEIRATERGNELDNIAKEADKVGADLIIVPQVLKPRVGPTPPPETGYKGPPPIIGEKPIEGQLPPEMLAEKIAAEKSARVQEAFSKPPFLRNASDKLILKESAGIIEGEPGFRPFGEIARDLKSIIDLDERGSITGETLSGDKLQAYYRLKNDFAAIARNAKRVGKTIDQYLTDLGVDPEVIKYIGQKTQEVTKEKGKGEPPPAIEPTIQGVEKPDIRVNLDRIANTENVKNIIGEMNLKQQAIGRIEETTRGVRGHEQTIAGAKLKKNQITVEDILTRKPGTLWNESQLLNVRDIRDSAAVKVEELTNKTLAGDPRAINDLPSALAIFGEIEAQRTGAVAEPARILESQKILSEAGRKIFDPKQLADLAQAVKDSAGDPVLLARRIKALEIPEQKATFARQLVNGLKKGQNIFTFAWINGLLSGPPTHVVNFATNGSAFLGGIETRRIAGRVGQVREFFGGDPGVQVGEANAMVYGSIEGFMDSLEVAKKAWMENETQFGTTGKIENYQKNPLSREALGLTGSYDHSIEFLANTIEEVGKVVGNPGRGLMVADEFWKGLNYRAELSARAFREASLEGLKGGEFGKRVRYIKDHPDEFPSIDEGARAFAEYQTFTGELGTIGKGIQRISNATLFTKIIAPFVRTPGNLLKYTQDYTPGLNMISRRFWEDMNAGGAQADIALSKMAMGSMFVATAAYLVKAGIMTGNGPYDPKLRKVWLEDHQPNSIKFGDTWVAFDRMDFPGNTFGIVADTMTMADDMDLDSIEQYLSAGALAVSEVMVNKTYLQGFSQALDAMKNPEKGSADWFKQWSRSLTPAIVRTINRSFFDDAMRDVNSISDALKAGTPGLSDSLPPRLGFWGQPIFPDALGPDLLSPYATKKDTHDPINEEIIANRLSLSMPSKVLGGYKPSENILMENQPRETWGIKLSSGEYYRYVTLARSESIIGDKSIHDRLEELIKSDTYQRQSTGPDGGRSLLIRSWINQYEAVAQEMLKKEFPDLAQKIRNQQIGRAEVLRPGQ